MKDDPLNAGKETISERGREASGTSEASTRKEKKATPRSGGPKALIGSVLSGRYRIDRLLGEGVPGPRSVTHQSHIGRHSDEHRVALNQGALTPEVRQANRFRKRVREQVRVYAVDLHEDAESA